MEVMFKHYARINVEFHGYDPDEMVLQFFYPDYNVDVVTLSEYAAWYVEQYNWRLQHDGFRLNYITLRDKEFVKPILYNVKEIKGVSYIGLALPAGE